MNSSDNVSSPSERPLPAPPTKYRPLPPTPKLSENGRKISVSPQNPNPSSTAEVAEKILKKTEEAHEPPHQPHVSPSQEKSLANTGAVVRRTLPPPPPPLKPLTPPQQKVLPPPLPPSPKLSRVGAPTRALPETPAELEQRRAALEAGAQLKELKKLSENPENKERFRADFTKFENDPKYLRALRSNPYIMSVYTQLKTKLDKEANTKSGELISQGASLIDKCGKGINSDNINNIKIDLEQLKKSIKSGGFTKNQIIPLNKQIEQIEGYLKSYSDKKFTKLKNVLSELNANSRLKLTVEDGQLKTTERSVLSHIIDKGVGTSEPSKEAVKKVLEQFRELYKDPKITLKQKAELEEQFQKFALNDWAKATISKDPDIKKLFFAVNRSIGTTTPRLAILQDGSIAWIIKKDGEYFRPEEASKSGEETSFTKVDIKELVDVNNIDFLKGKVKINNEEIDMPLDSKMKENLPKLLRSFDDNWAMSVGTLASPMSFTVSGLDTPSNIDLDLAQSRFQTDKTTPFSTDTQSDSVASSTRIKAKDYLKSGEFCGDFASVQHFENMSLAIVSDAAGNGKESVEASVMLTHRMRALVVAGLKEKRNNGQVSFEDVKETMKLALAQAHLEALGASRKQCTLSMALTLTDPNGQSFVVGMSIGDAKALIRKSDGTIRDLTPQLFSKSVTVSDGSFGDKQTDSCFVFVEPFQRGDEVMLGSDGLGDNLEAKTLKFTPEQAVDHLLAQKGLPPEKEKQLQKYKDIIAESNIKGLKKLKTWEALHPIRKETTTPEMKEQREMLQNIHNWFVENRLKELIQQPGPGSTIDKIFAECTSTKVSKPDDVVVVSLQKR